MPTPLPPDPPSEETDPLIDRLLTMVESQMKAHAESNLEQLDSQNRMLKWSFGMTMVCLAAICALSGANLAINAGFIDVSTYTAPEPVSAPETAPADEAANEAKEDTGVKEEAAGPEEAPELPEVITPSDPDDEPN